MTIIERDIEFYEACVEGHYAEFRRCYPKDEEGHQLKKIAAQKVVESLKEYMATLLSVRGKEQT